jgi:integrase
MMGEINADVLRKYQLARGEKVTATTINLETRMIGQILRENQMWRRIGSTFRQLHEHPSRGRAFTPEELARLLDAADQRPSVIGPVIRLILETGMRHKEVRTLRMGNVDLERKILRIQRDGTKTAAGERWIPLTDEGCRVLRILIERARSLGAVDDSHYIFPTVRNRKNGRSVYDPTIPQSSFTGGWWAVREAAGIDKTLRLHDLRHHVATDMAAAGVPSGVAMKLLGWNTPRMRERYEHLQDTSLRVGIEQLEEMRERRKKRMAVDHSCEIGIPKTRVA